MPVLKTGLRSFRKEHISTRNNLRSKDAETYLVRWNSSRDEITHANSQNKQAWRHCHSPRAEEMPAHWRGYPCRRKFLSESEEKNCQSLRNWSRKDVGLEAETVPKGLENYTGRRHRRITKDPAPYGERPIEKCYLSSRPTSPPVVPKETGNFSVPCRDVTIQQQGKWK